MELYKFFFSGKDSDDNTPYRIDDEKNNAELINKLNNTQKAIVEDYFNFLEEKFLNHNLKLFTPPTDKTLSRDNLIKLDRAKKSFGLVVTLTTGDYLNEKNFWHVLSLTYNINQAHYLQQIYRITHGTIEDTNQMISSVISPQITAKEKTIIKNAACALFCTLIKKWLEPNFPDYEADALNFVKFMTFPSQANRGLKK